MVDGLTPEKRDAPVLRVLVVDDNRDAADSLCTLLKIWGYDCRVAYDGNEGLEVARDYRPDCLLLDICMPRMDGYLLARHLRQQSGMEKVKLIALTAYSDEWHVSHIREAGFDYHLVKPADPSDIERILTMLNEVVRLAGRTEELARLNVAIASETRDLIQEVKEDIREIKDEVKEIKEELRGTTDDPPRKHGRDNTPPAS
jgi:two-component system OmpR family response regulator